MLGVQHAIAAVGHVQIVDVQEAVGRGDQHTKFALYLADRHDVAGRLLRYHGGREASELFHKIGYLIRQILGRAHQRTVYVGQPALIVLFLRPVRGKAFGIREREKMLAKENLQKKRSCCFHPDSEHLLIIRVRFLQLEDVHGLRVRAGGQKQRILAEAQRVDRHAAGVASSELELDLSI